MSPEHLAVAIIPARGGSKRIPNKNIRPMLGVPLISRTIKNLFEADFFDAILVSTDAPAVADIAKESGAIIPFMRSADLADDLTPTLPVIQDAIKKISDPKILPETLVCCVYPGAFLISPNQFRESFMQAQHLEVGSFLVGMSQFPHPIQRAFQIDFDGMLEAMNENDLPKRTQDLRISYHDAGQFYWARASTWLAANSILGSRCKGYEIKRQDACDIDTEEDWLVAEALLVGKTRRE